MGAKWNAVKGIRMMSDNRRTGDTVAVEGDYQYAAASSQNPVQRYWHLNKQTMISKYLPPASSDEILDVGCGSGVITDFLGKSGANVLGIDGNRDAISFAKRTFAKNNVTFKEGLIDSSFSSSSTIDKIYCLELLEHIYLHQGKDLLESFYRILKPSGALFLTTPNYRSLWPFIEFGMDLFKLAPPLIDHQHVERYTRTKLKNLCLEVGFTVENIYTSCFLAPWLAGVNWKLAQKIGDWEASSRMPLGSILIIVLKK